MILVALRPVISRAASGVSRPGTTWEPRPHGESRFQPGIQNNRDSATGLRDCFFLPVGLWRWDDGAFTNLFLSTPFKQPPWAGNGPVRMGGYAQGPAGPILFPGVRNSTSDLLAEIKALNRLVQG